MIFTLDQSKGFSSLGLIGAVSVGSILSLGYINLSHYLIAQSALEQATRAAVRCVTPTEGECSELIQPATQPQWRYSASILSPTGDVYSEEFDYSAKMFRERFVAQTPYYLIPQEVAPKVRLTTYSVPAALYEEIPALKRIQLRFRYQAQEEHITALPLGNPFPSFDAKFEDDHDTLSFDVKQLNASRSRREVLDRFKLVFNSSFTRTISGTESDKENGEFVRYVNFGSGTDVSLSSLLAGEAETENCEPGSLCSVRSQAGGAGIAKLNDYKDFRYLALYLEVEITNRTPNASLGIKGEGGKSGLILDITGDKHEERICLGGRALTKLNTTNGGYFNLRLRGAADSNGGDKEFEDPECGGSYRLSNILIDKGGSFKPKIGLQVGGQAGDRVSGKVKLYAFVDTYNSHSRFTPITKDCSPVYLQRGLTLSQVAPSPTICGLTGNETNIVRQLGSLSEINSGCSDKGQDETNFPVSLQLPEVLSETFSIAPKDLQPREIAVAQCVENTVPQEPSTCGWIRKGESEKQMEIGTLPEGSCERSKKVTITTDCNDNVAVATCEVENLHPSSCRSVQAKAEQLTAFKEIKDLPIGSNNEFGKELVRGASIAPLYSCEQRKNNGVDCGVLKTKTVSSLPQLKRTDPNWRPTTIASYEVDGEEPICGEITSDQVALVASEPEEIMITGHPFDGERALEISEDSPKLVGSKIQCSNDPTMALTLEERLREYAALNGLLEARDREIKFEYEAKSLGSTQLVSSTIGCLTKAFASLDGCPQLRTISIGNESCGEEINLGSSENEPDFCRKPGVSCKKVFDGISSAPPVAPNGQESVRIAEELASNILQKYLPQSKSNCTTQSCTKVKIELNPDKTVSASSSYQMPLSWPLNELLGRKSLPLNKLRTERIEAL